MACFFHITVYGEHLSMLQKYISTTFKKNCNVFYLERVYQNLLNQFPITVNLWDFPPQFCYYKWNPFLIISLGWRHRFDPWAGKVPWTSSWQPTLVFLPGESHGQKSLTGYSP